MREIGSEFWTNCTNETGFGIESYIPKGFNSFFLLSGRTALDIVVDDICMTNRIKKVYFPSYCCHTMLHPFVEKGIEIEFYSVVFKDGHFEFDYSLENDCDTVFLIDYFGFLNSETLNIASIEKKNGKG